MYHTDKLHSTGDQVMNETLFCRSSTSLIKQRKKKEQEIIEVNNY